MKILVIFTGGTIGSTNKDGYIGPDASKAFRLIELYRAGYGHEVEFDSAEPYSILSENITCADYSGLVQSVRKALDSSYDGIIVTHGSDTLQFSAAMLSYTLGRTGIPVLLVASNYVLEDPRANGLNNFSCAVEFIKQQQGQGVFVAYQNPGDSVCTIHRGERTMPFAPYSDSLYSLCNVTYATYQAPVFVKNPEYSDIHKCSTITVADEAEAESGILQIEAAPGTGYPTHLEGIKAVIHRTYHSGTICSISTGLRTFMKQCHLQGVPVFLLGNSPGTDYESCRVYEELGIIVVPQVSPSAFYIKLWLGIQAGWDLLELCESNLTGEYM